jgi:Regulator of chromosome condensation (RCC1) repeat
MTGRTVHAIRVTALLAATTLTTACSPDSGPEDDESSSAFPPDGGDGAATSDVVDASTSFDGPRAQDAASSSPTSDGEASTSPGDAAATDAPADTASPGDAAASDAPPDTALEATPDAGADAASDAKDDTTVTPVEGGPPVSADGGDAQPPGFDGSLPGCGTWLSASPTHAGNRGAVQLTATGRTAGFGAVLDWNVTEGAGTGQFTNMTATSATFTCFTPGPVVVTATDPAGTPCVDTGYDQASVVIQCDGFVGQWASVSVGAAGACGVTVDGAAWCWSDAPDDFGLGNGTTTSSPYPAAVSALTSGEGSVSVGNEFACALATSGAVECWGPGSTPAPLTGLPDDVTAISSGAQAACALSASQGLLCWGDNSFGELGDGTTSSSAVPVAVGGLTGSTAAVSMGGAVACALSTTGVVHCWGDDSSGELGTSAPAAAFSASPVAVAGLPAPITAVAAGGAFACALGSGGAVYCWGANDRAELGNASGTSSAIPVQVGGLPLDVRSIAAGQNFACALTSSGAVWCWGDDFSGELGDDAAASLSFTSVSAVPVPVIGLTSGVASLSLGGQSACAITSGGELLCWGSDSVGQLGNPTTSFCATGPAANACLPVPLPIESPAPLVPGGGVASGWCSQQGTHTLCEDFDQGFPGQFTVQPSAGSTVGEDDVDDQSPPRSMVATTSPISPLDVESTAWATFVSPAVGPDFQLQADFQVGSDCFANVSRSVTLARVDYLDVGYTLAYSVSPALSGAGFVFGVGESESTPQTPGPLGPSGTGSSFVLADQWARLTLWADLRASGSSGGFSVTVLTPNAPADAEGGGLFGPSQAPASAPVLRIGADAATHGCTIHIDNVFFDVQ